MKIWYLIKKWFRKLFCKEEVNETTIVEPIIVEEAGVQSPAAPAIVEDIKEDEDMLRNSIIGAGGSGGLASIDLSAFVHNAAKSSQIYNKSGDDFGSGISNLTRALERGMEVKPDGTQVWLMDRAINEVVEVTLAGPWDWSSMNITARSVPPSSSGWTNIGPPPIWADDGNLCYFHEDGGSVTGNINTVYQYTASTPYSIATLSYVGSSNVMSPLLTTAGALWEFMYPYEDGSGWTIIEMPDKAYYVTMSTPHSLATASLVSTTAKVIPSIDTSDPVRWLNGGWFNPKGTQFAKGSIREKGVSVFELGTPFDVSTCVQTGWLDTDPIGPTHSVEFSKKQDTLMISNRDGANCRFSIYEA
jgi:hypothetical protein